MHQQPDKGEDPVLAVVKVLLTIEAGPGVSCRVAEKELKRTLQKEEVNQDETEEILETGDFRIYTTTKEDTLWHIAEKFYGSGSYFPVLMECNPSLNIFDMEKGIPVRILKDNLLALRLYRKITGMVGNRICFYYRVRKGDSFESIAGKFYNNEELAKRIREFNPHSELVPGKRIRIALN